MGISSGKMLDNWASFCPDICGREGKGFMCGRRVSEPQSVLGDGRCGRGALELCFGMVRGIVGRGLLWYGMVRVW